METRTIAQLADELAAKDQQLKDLSASYIEQINIVAEMQNRALMAEAQLTAAQSALRESEAARGEAEKDSGRLEWLFKEWDGRYSKLLEKPFATYGYDPTIPSFRVAIDRKWSDEDAARAQEAKPSLPDESSDAVTGGGDK